MRFGLRQLFFIILCLGLFTMTIFPVADPDFWWHLRTGQLIAQTHAIPHADPFSFTKIGEPWIAHEWLTELFMYGLYLLGGYGLLIFVFALTITGAFLLAYARSPHESRPYVAGFTMLFGAVATWPIWGVRPQMISLLLTSLVLFLLDRYQSEGKLRFLLPLPLITLVWVNLHAGYLLGLVIIAIYIGGNVLEALAAPILKTQNPNAPTLKFILILCAVLAASVLATLVNPNGVHILIYPFETLTSPSMQKFIVEWFSPDFHDARWQPLVWFFLALIGAGMLSNKPISPIKILLTLAFGYAALRSMRNIPLFIIVAAPILTELIDSLLRVKPQVLPPGRLMKWVAPVLVIGGLLIAGLRFVQVAQGQAQTEAIAYPKAATDWIESNRPPGNIFNSYFWGGYLIWRLHPDYQVYIDGRADVYGDEFIYSYQDVIRAEPGWEQNLDTWSVRLVIVEPASPLAEALRRSTGWDNVYEDAMCVIFQRK